MLKKRIHVTDAELAVLNVLWNDGPSTIRQIAERLYPEKTTAEYATVQKLLERLEAKHSVTRDRSQYAHVFATVIDREEIIGQQLQDLADKLCSGSTAPLLIHFVKRTRLTAADREILRRLIDEAD